MIDCNLGPDFKSCFLGHKQSEYGKTFTVRLAKHMCYEDVRRDNKEYEAAKEMILSGAKKGFNTVSLYNGDKAVQLYVTVCPYVL